MVKSKHIYSSYTLGAMIFIFLAINAVAVGFENIKFMGTDDVPYAVAHIDDRPIFDSYPFYVDVQRGKVSNMNIVHKFGTNEALSSNWEVVSTTGVYQTPNKSRIIEVVSSSASDGINGSGAQQIIIIGLNSSWYEQSILVNLNGTTPVILNHNFTRIYRAYVTQSGNYADLSTGSHVGTITIREQGGGTVWGQIGLIDGFPAGQTEIGAYTIPRGKTGYLLSKFMMGQANKPVDVSIFQRTHINETTAPFNGAMRILEHHHGMDSPIGINPRSPIIEFPEMTDVGFLAKVSTTGSVSVDFEILLIDK